MRGAGVYCKLRCGLAVDSVTACVTTTKLRKVWHILRQCADSKLPGLMRFIELPTPLFGSSHRRFLSCFCSEAFAAKTPVFGRQSKLGATRTLYIKFIVRKPNITKKNASACLMSSSRRR